MKKEKTIIVVDDNKGVLSAVELLLKRHFDKIILLNSPITLPTRIKQDAPDVILLDMNFGGALTTAMRGCIG